MLASLDLKKKQSMSISIPTRLSFGLPFSSNNIRLFNSPQVQCGNICNAQVGQQSTVRVVYACMCITHLVLQ